ncbi:MAG: alpha-galactosidase [Actinomycetota bacterium]
MTLGDQRDEHRRTELVHLRHGETSVVLATVDGHTPAVRYWGRALGDDDVADVEAATERPLPRAILDVEPTIGIVNELGEGMAGSPGIAGHRPGGDAYGPAFADAVFERPAGGPGRSVTCRLTDRRAQLSLTISLTLGLDDLPSPVGAEVLRVDVSLTNDGSTPYVVERLTAGVELPARADELLTFSGRWTLELQPQRHRWQPGAWVSENWRGRTSHDRPPALFAGSAGFDETSGEVWGMQLGWSGNSRLAAERLSDGRRLLQVGELLYPGEVILEPGRTHTAPTVYGAYGASGLAEVSQAFHELVRSRSHHPGPDRPRPVILNTWEAVYFDHDVDTLRQLATVAADVGVERFVVDDGWFVGRHDDTAALGDWIVDPAKYPDGLGPLIAHVNDLGMEFGLWFEPEMINPDSELYRAHPEWALHDERYPLRTGRNQLVLDLVNPDAWKHICDRLNRLLSDHSIAYIKWDMNRDLARPTLEPSGAAGARAQTLAFYALVDELRRLHPGVEIESCASGGAGADVEVLARTERIWVSDSNDALDRQAIQRGFSLLFPPEVMGSHVGPPTSHTTGRQHDLAFRGATALLGHFGIEWNLLRTDAAERADLAMLVSLHKRHRALLHSGRFRRLDGDPGANTTGVVATDRSEALFVHARIASSLDAVHQPIRFVGLDPDRRYRVHCPAIPGRSRDRGMAPPQWFAAAADEETALTFSGRVLAEAGLIPPVLDPESAIVIHLLAV